MKVINDLDVYGYSNLDDVVQGPVTEASLEVISHRSDRDLIKVKVQTPDGQPHEFIVKGYELIRAIENSINI